jgi:hypothetical protein
MVTQTLQSDEDVVETQLLERCKTSTRPPYRGWPALARPISLLKVSTNWLARWLKPWRIINSKPPLVRALDVYQF